MSDRDVILSRLQRMVSALPPEEQLRALAWIEATLDGENGISRGILELCINGQAEIVAVPPDNEGPRFRLLEAGMAEALTLVHDKPELRELFAKLSGQPVGDPPKDVQ